MNLKLLLKENTEKRKGSLSVEAVFITPLFVFMLLFFMYLIQSSAAYTRMNRAVCRTCETMAAYANLYHTHGIKSLEDTLLSELSDYTEIIPESDKSIEILSYFINMRTLAGFGDDILYSETAKQIYLYYYNSDTRFTDYFTETEDVNFTGSSFFDSDNTILLNVTGNVKPVVPLPDFFPSIKLNCIQKCNAWLYGTRNSFAVKEENIWSMDNLKRGKYIRKRCGANLSEFYPVISTFIDGSAVMIKSLDHTKETYRDGKELYKTIVDYVCRLDEFQGTDNEKYKNYTPVIKSTDIRSKTLHLVMPTNSMNERQSMELMNATTYATTLGIKVEIELLGVSGNDL